MLIYLLISWLVWSIKWLFRIYQNPIWRSQMFNFAHDQNIFSSLSWKSKELEEAGIKEFYLFFLLYLQKCKKLQQCGNVSSGTEMMKRRKLLTVQIHCSNHHVITPYHRVPNVSMNAAKCILHCQCLVICLVMGFFINVQEILVSCWGGSTILLHRVAVCLSWGFTKNS